MRTIASTFKTREEAEAAARRLQAIGVAQERISVRDLAEPGGGAGEPGGPGIFVSAKVTPEQVSAANEILKAPRAEERPPPAVPERNGPARGSALAGAPPDEEFRVEEAKPAAEPAGVSHPAAPKTAPPAAAEPGRPEIKQIPGRIPGAAEPPPQPARAADHDMRRQIALVCLLVAASFVLGALLRVFG